MGRPLGLLHSPFRSFHPLFIFSFLKIRKNIKNVLFKQKMFAPSLPGDTLMNVFVIEDRLVVIHYTVQQAHTNASLNPSKNTKLNNNPISGQALFHTVGSVL